MQGTYFLEVKFCQVPALNSDGGADCEASQLVEYGKRSDPVPVGLEDIRQWMSMWKFRSKTDCAGNTYTYRVRRISHFAVQQEVFDIWDGLVQSWYAHISVINHHVQQSCHLGVGG